MPTWQRAHVLRRAIDSVLVQTYGNLELVVCDNASQDGTEAICEEYGRLDPRVRYFRHATNIGATANFNSILRRARGDYVMLLADDDWIEDTYLQHCLGALRDHPDRVLARGKARYFEADGLVRWSEQPVSLIESSPSRRVRAYFGSVEWNDEFYGLIRQDIWARVGPIPKGVGNENRVVARMAFLGKMVTLETTEYNRATGGMGSNAATVAEEYGLSPRQLRASPLSAAWSAVSDIAWRSSIYEPLTPMQRLVLALSCVPSWLVRVHFRRVRKREMDKARKRVRRWSRRFKRGGRRRLKKVSKRARVARRRSVRLLRRRAGALLLRR